MHVYYSDDYTASEFAFDTTRKSGEIAKSLHDRPIPGVEIVPPPTGLADPFIARIHRKDYVDAVDSGTPEDLASSQGFNWDPGIPVMARAHNAGLVAAVRYVVARGGVAGSLSSGLHHASFDSGMGYCTFNGVAVAAVCAVSEGAERVLVLDFDAHCGGGTWDILGESVVHVDVSTNRFDSYIPTGQSRLAVVEGNAYEVTIREALDYATSIGPFDVVVYNAGMDPVNDGYTATEMALRERMVADWAAINAVSLVYAMAGGYTWRLTMNELVDLHRLTIAAFA